LFTSYQNSVPVFGRRMASTTYGRQPI